MKPLLDQPLGQIARRLAGATAVFREYGLDFCCNGNRTLRAAASDASQDAGAIAARLQGLRLMAESDERDWAAASPKDLIAHILERYHEVHREQFPELIRLARRVEQVHGERAECPLGLADHLCAMQQMLESHMQKEEMILFPMIERGAGAMAGGPIYIMRMEHDEHGQELQRMAEMTNNLMPPSQACTAWRALYMGLGAMRDDLMQHIHLENNILFEHALNGQPAASA
ncbi:MAG: iron-sulfur cluster repair protein YtfE [Burkholderiaceae bacterium]|jgi:regulator of cell morphogenesis and NO signaling|nr:iron-sulfur cluster repair protein YtfE [Burkholderiaceae bacterium]